MNSNAAGSPSQSGGPQLIRPEHIQNMPHLDSQQKARYHTALSQMWSIIKSKPQDSQEYKFAMDKIRSATKNISDGLLKFRNAQGAQQKPQTCPQ